MLNVTLASCDYGVAWAMRSKWFNRSKMLSSQSTAGNNHGRLPKAASGVKLLDMGERGRNRILDAQGDAG